MDRFTIRVSTRRQKTLRSSKRSSVLVPGGTLQMSNHALASLSSAGISDDGEDSALMKKEERAGSLVRHRFRLRLLLARVQSFRHAEESRLHFHVELAHPGFDYSLAHRRGTNYVRFASVRVRAREKKKEARRVCLQLCSRHHLLLAPHFRLQHPKPERLSASSNGHGIILSIVDAARGAS